MITGKTKNLGVMGWPIAHSLSPGMQQAAIAAAGADYSYIAMPVRPERLAEAVAGLRAVEFCGWNVTIPHKRAIMPLLDEIAAAYPSFVPQRPRQIGYGPRIDGTEKGPGFAAQYLPNGSIMTEYSARTGSINVGT